MNATHARGIFVVCLNLIVVGIAYAGLPQAATQPSQQIRDHFQRGQAALQANDAASAEREFRAILALDPKNAGAHAGLGVVVMGRGDCKTASQEFLAALAAQPAFAKARALLGICQKKLGDPAARASLEKAFAKLQEKPLRRQVGMELAGLYESEGNFDGTASVMQALVNLDPDNVDVLFMAQRVYSDMADDTLNKLAVVAPASARMQQVIAEKLVNAGDLKGAIEHYRKALAIDQRLPGARYELGEAILESAPSDPAGQGDAEKEFAAAIDTEGDSAKVECQLGRIAFLRADFEQAYAHYNRAITLNPGDEGAQMGLARLLMSMEKPEQAMKYLRMAVESDPLNAEAHYRLVAICRKLKRTEEAEKELKLFLEIKQTKERVRELYRQMNKRPRGEDEPVSEPEP